MNAGLANLTTLKRHLLAEKVRADIRWDDEILAIGLGVAGAFESYCDRKFLRVAGGTFQTVCAGRSIFVLPRYPIETVTAVDLRMSYGAAWEAQTITDTIESVSEEAGLVVLYASIGTDRSSIRFTYTGGFWWDTSEDSSGVQPEGSTAAPADLVQAWLLQCQDIWARRDNLGVGITAKPTERAKLSELDLSPAVRSVLRTYQRHG